MIPSDSTVGDVDATCQAIEELNTCDRVGVVVVLGSSELGGSLVQAYLGWSHEIILHTTPASSRASWIQVKSGINLAHRYCLL